MAHKTYPGEFKLPAVKMITDQGLSVAEVARRLGVTEGCLRAWREAARGPGAAAFPGGGRSGPRRGRFQPAETDGSLPGENHHGRAGEDRGQSHGGRETSRPVACGALPPDEEAGPPPERRVLSRPNRLLSFFNV